MATGFLLVFGLVFLAIGALFLAYPGSMPDSGMVSPNAIKSDPEAAAAEAQRWNQLRGLVAAVIGIGFLVGGIGTLL